jgi:Recombination endonuclease VII
MFTGKRKPPVIRGDEKQCEECGKFKSLRDGFYAYPSKDGPKARNRCIDCFVNKSVTNYAANREVLKARQREIYRAQVKANPRIGAERKLKQKLKRHGATMEWYEAKRLEQDDLCAICKQPERAKGTIKHYEDSTIRLAIDHDHETNRVRGLLCSDCNTKLGVVELHDWLSKAVEYLAKHQPSRDGDEHGSGRQSQGQ